MEDGRLGNAKCIEHRVKGRKWKMENVLYSLFKKE
jgi:hypothetical protein